ncbi:MAG: phosphate signaling complex protein PhoU [Rikenellaceae bacterium]|nr:phosphate signaling complex protein PhoU [Rikenellaceae bacterium]
MKHAEESIKNIKKALAEMWVLVEGQIDKAGQALLENNKDYANDVIIREKLVICYELIIYRECVNFFALLTPVAVDLRLILSVVKINNNLERIGDFAEGISRFVAEDKLNKITPQMKEELRLEQMLSEVSDMLSLCKHALANEDTTVASKVFAKDNKVDEIYWESLELLSKYIKENTDVLPDALNLNAAIRRIERIGDRCSNIAEDIVFYVEAKVLKHIHKKEE